MYFIKFNTPIIDDIRREVNEFIPNDFAKNTKLGYVGNHQITHEKILSLTSIKNLFTSLNLKIEDVALCVFSVCMPKQGFQIHIDKGQYQLSMNIPLNESVGSYVNFYKTETTPVELTVGPNSFYSIDDKDCTLVARVETDRPCIIDTKIPHKVINNTDRIRTLLLIRFKPEIKFSHFKLVEQTGIEPVVT